MIVSSTSEITPNAASGAGTRIRTGRAVRVGQPAVGPHQLDRAVLPRVRGVARAQLDAEVALARRSSISTLASPTVTRSGTPGSSSVTNWPGCAARPPRPPRPRRRRRVAGCRAPGRARTTPSGPPCPTYVSIRKCSGVRPALRRAGPRPTGCSASTSEPLLASHVSNLVSARIGFNGRHAARRRRRHLRDGRRHPLAQGQGRGDRLAPAPRRRPDDVETVTAYVGGALLQRRTGLGWRGLSSLPAPAARRRR